jgi:hypothetical protein
MFCRSKKKGCRPLSRNRRRAGRSLRESALSVGQERFSVFAKIHDMIRSPRRASDLGQISHILPDHSRLLTCGEYFQKLVVEFDAAL